MKNLVFVSFENDAHDQCVDVFSRPDGSFGFEEFRRDPEDQGFWQSMSRHSHRRFDAELAALVEADKRVPWLADSPLWQTYLAAARQANSPYA
jgi:hypothetical protein